MIQIILAITDIVLILLFLGCTIGLIYIIYQILDGDGCLSEDEYDLLNLRLKILSGIAAGSLILAIILSTILFALFKTRISKQFPWATVVNVFQYTCLLISIVILTMIIYWCIRMIRGDFCNKTDEFKKQMMILGILFLIFIIPSFIVFLIRIVKASGKILQWLFQSAKYATKPGINQITSSIKSSQGGSGNELIQNFAPLLQTISSTPPTQSSPIPSSASQQKSAGMNQNLVGSLMQNPEIQKGIKDFASNLLKFKK